MQKIKILIVFVLISIVGHTACRNATAIEKKTYSNQVCEQFVKIARYGLVDVAVCKATSDVKVCADEFFNGKIKNYVIANFNYSKTYYQTHKKQQNCNVFIANQKSLTLENGMDCGDE